MKIEKVNENQLRLTLTFQDLAERGIRLEDFIRPSDHTQALFREIMGQALEEYDFISENTPLMVEASPIAGEGISILITKVEQGEHMEKAVQKLRSFTPQTTKESALKQKQAAKNSSEKEMLLLYTFDTLDDVIHLAIRLNGNCHGQNALYRYNQKLYFAVHLDATLSDEAYQRTEAILGEYGKKLTTPPLGETFLREHGEMVLAADAIGTLAAHFKEV